MASPIGVANHPLIFNFYYYYYYFLMWGWGILEKRRVKMVELQQFESLGE
jgi:hypothetical protein